jgi:hypothetical protein
MADIESKPMTTPLTYLGYQKKIPMDKGTYQNPTLLGMCWQPIHIFHYLISCLHQCFTNIDFSSQISNERRLSSLSLHNCKHENFSLRGLHENHNTTVTREVPLISFSLLQVECLFSKMVLS